MKVLAVTRHVKGDRMDKLVGYSDYPGFGWVQLGRLVVNYQRGRVSSVFLNGEQIL